MGVRIFGDDLNVLQAKVGIETSLIEKTPCVVDVCDGLNISGPALVTCVNPLQASQAGFDTAEVRGQLEPMVRSPRESWIHRVEKLIGVRVPFPNPYHFEIDRIERVRLINSSGVPVPLESIASFEKTEGHSEIDREGLRQMVAVAAWIGNRDVGRTVQDIH